MKAKAERNLWEIRPARCFEHRMTEEGRAAILVPRFRSRWMGWLQRRLRKPYVQLKLDDLGTAVWLACDGQRDLGQIAHEMEKRFGEGQEKLDARLALFIQALDRGGLLEME